MRTLTCAIVLGAGGLGCGEEATSDGSVGWADFAEDVEESFEGRAYYRVEWDLGFSSLDGLRSYYESMNDGDGAGFRLAVHQVGGADDVWSRDRVQDLRYCVSSEFDGQLERAVSEMKMATSDWMRVANVRFVHVPSEVEDCTGGNLAVDFAVRPWSNGGACAFFPSVSGCVPRTLVINFDDFDLNPVWNDSAPGITTVGVFRHELGHILGFRHEHIRPEAGGGCAESDDWRPLTPYDASSVMHYQWCNGVASSDLRVTKYDSIGSMAAYGTSSALLNASVF